MGSWRAWHSTGRGSVLLGSWFSSHMALCSHGMGDRACLGGRREPSKCLKDSFISS